jgi:hypothetical protein
MTELHNMSVPPRSVLSVQRAVLSGRRYRISSTKTLCTWTGLDEARLTDCLRRDGAACALALLRARRRPMTTAFATNLAKHRLDAAAPATLRQTCDVALSRLGLPEGFGFFVDESLQSGDRELSTTEAIAVLAARSGPLYLPGRFEPSLIVPRDVTLFFPSNAADEAPTGDRRATTSTEPRRRRPSLKGAAR